MADATTTETAAATPAAAGAATAAAATTAAATTTTTAAATTGATTAATGATTTPLAADDWRADLPDDLKEHASRFTTKADVVKGHLALRQQLSKAIIPPGKDAKPEDVATYRKALGVPDTPDGYKFPTAEGEVITDDIKAVRAEWAKEFHAANLSQAQVDQVLTKYAARAEAERTAIVEADKRHATSQDDALKKEWGADYDRNKTFANRAFKDLAERAGVAVDELTKIETKAGRFLFDDARMLKVFATIGREMGEGNLGPVVSDSERNDMQSQLRTIRAGIETAKSKRDSGEANRLYQEEMRLIARISGNRPIVGSQGRAA